MLERGWLALRLALVILAVRAGFERAHAAELEPWLDAITTMPWLVPINLVLGPILVLVVVGVQSVLSAAPWTRPSWLANPLREPVQFFHAMSFGLLGFALGLVTAGATLAAMYVACSGLGLRLGVASCERAFRSKFSPPSS